jgi:hypothetical protein
MGNQTPVEWLEELLHFECNYSINNEVIINYDVLDNIIIKAKQMEKEHIMMAYIDGRINQGLKQSKSSEQYYNETYKQQENGK